MAYSGNFTLYQYNDSLTFSAYIGVNGGASQQYNPTNGAFSPDWSTNNLILTPTLTRLVTGSGDLVNGSNVTVTWYTINKATGAATLITNSGNYIISTSPQRLTINGNILSTGTPEIIIRADIAYYDLSTGMTITTRAQKALTLVSNGSGGTDAITSHPGGNIFKNGTPSTLTLHAALMRPAPIVSVLTTAGSTTTNIKVSSTANFQVGEVVTIGASNATISAIPDSTTLTITPALGVAPGTGVAVTLVGSQYEEQTSVAFQWFQDDATVLGTTIASTSTTTVLNVTAGQGSQFTNGMSILVGAATATVASSTANTITLQSALGAAPAVGTVIVSSTGDIALGAGWKKLTNSGTVSGVTTKDLVVYPGQLVKVNGNGNPKGIFRCKVTDTNTSYNYFDQEIVQDMSDPIRVTIDSTTGNIYKNSSVSATLNARVWRKNTELDTGGTIYTYTWTAFDPYLNTQVKFGDGSASKTGKTLAIGLSDLLAASPTPVASATPISVPLPTSPNTTTIWLDTSVTPNVPKKWVYANSSVQTTVATLSTTVPSYSTTTTTGSTTTSIILTSGGGVNFWIGAAITVNGQATVVTNIVLDTLTVSPAVTAPASGVTVALASTTTLINVASSAGFQVGQNIQINTGTVSNVTISNVSNKTLTTSACTSAPTAGMTVVLTSQTNKVYTTANTGMTVGAIVYFGTTYGSIASVSGTGPYAVTLNNTLPAAPTAGTNIYSNGWTQMMTTGASTQFKCSVS